MADVRFEHSSAGYVELMKSGEMQGVLRGYASEIQSSASNAISADKWSEPLYEPPYATYDFMGKDRAGVRVQTNNPHAKLAERKHGILQNAAGV